MNNNNHDKTQVENRLMVVTSLVLINFFPLSLDINKNGISSHFSALHLNIAMDHPTSEQG